MRKTKIGLIGFGRFGKLAAKYLSENFDIYVFDKKIKSPGKKSAEKIIFAPLKSVCKCSVVIVCVPISELEKLLHQIKNLVKKDSLIVDACSVKEYPSKLMEKILPGEVQILATHPLFGPDTALNSLKGRKIVLCRIKVSNKLYAGITKFLENKGLTVVESTPKEHDREIAKTLVLTHFIGRTMLESGAKDSGIGTNGYTMLMEVIDTVKNDTWQLFDDMNKYNRYSKNARDKFIRSANKINNRLK
ncbi:MAG TPA: prephenate dehydrogenase/arogenate dehydrogenase family protein [Candidatus Nanoarchaeia archaeon]|nr:prephenate dehydrogenase/arogenate dehydrogenase family protein [Candidatus Nanoarchaeia archaeon]